MPFSPFAPRVPSQAGLSSGHAFSRHARCFPLLPVLALLLSLLFPPAVARSAEGAPGDAAKQFAFGEALFAEGDYYRAITEYKRLVFFSPQDALAEKAAFRIAESYFKAKRWAEAVDAFEAFYAHYPRSLQAAEALYFKGLAEKELKRYQNALSTFQEIIRTKSEQFADKATYQSGLIELETGKPPQAAETFSLVPDKSPLYPSARVMAAGLARMDDIPRKSPALAGGLAALLPGAGHLYTERYVDAGMAFLLNGAFIWAAVELARRDIPVAAGLVSFFELGWYTGNIYSAVSSAHKYNEREKESYIKKLKDSAGFSLGFNPVTSTVLAAYTFKY